MSIAQPYLPSPFIHTAVKRRKNTWYTIASGNWSDPNIWMSNSRRRYSSPQTGDDVSIGLGHTVTFDTANSSTTTINNFFVAGSFVISNSGSRTLTILGDLQSTGSVNLTATGTITLNLYGVNNYINSFVAGTTSTIVYIRSGDQAIMDLSYRHLTVQSIGTKYLTNNLNISGNFIHFSCIFEMSSYDFTVNGTSTWGTGGTFGVISKTGVGSILSVGSVSWQSGSINFSGNPIVEFRGGLSTSLQTTTTTSGTNVWNFTTNTQSITLGSSITLDATVSIVGAITVTNAAGAGNLILNKAIDNTVAGGSVINKGQIYFNSTSSLPSFTTGTFDRTSFSNTVGYTMGASITLPYTSYSSLLVSNTGTKTSVGNTTLSGNLTVSNAVTASGTYDLGAFDISISGTTNITNGTLLKTGGGNVLFTGLVTTGSISSAINFSGNPTVEVRGGLFSNFNPVFSSGTGQWTFSTNNQSIATAVGTGSTVRWNFDAPILISGAITLTTSSPNGATMAVGLRQPINGNSAASTLANAARVDFLTVASVSSMTIGVFNYAATSTNATSALGYQFDGSYTIPYTSLNGLVIGGTGTKTLSGNTILNYGLIVSDGFISSTGSLELSAFNLTVGATTTAGANSSITKSGAGTILFTGLCTLQLTIGANFDFTGGNPSIEYRGGLTLLGGNNALTILKTGTGIWSFTTNNQSFTNIGGQTAQLDCPVLISGAITLTTSGAGIAIFTNTINGNNAASTLDNRITGSLQYQNAQRPMLTGVLQTNAAANTFIYNAAGNQSITGGTYRTLTLAGSGVKTLQGNVVVATLYTLTPPATLALNGFTRT